MSHDEPRSNYCKFGQTAEAAQLLESTIVTCLLGIGGLENNWHNKPDPLAARQALETLEEKTLGPLIREIQKYVDFECDFPDLLRTALKTRNRLVHGWFESHNLKIQTNDGRAAMLDDLEAMHSELFQAWQVMQLAASGIVYKVTRKSE
jgi:hypothetical protein